MPLPGAVPASSLNKSMATVQVNFRLSQEGKEILLALQDRFGTSQSGVFERLLRDEKMRLEKSEGFKVGRKLGGRGT